LDKESGRDVVEHMKRLAREQGTTILIVTHDNRILDVADRIVHLEDGYLMSFTDSVISNNDHMMGLLADANEKVNIQAEIEKLNEQDFKRVLQDMSNESLRFLKATSLANDHAYQSLLEQSLFAFVRKLSKIVGAERASLFLVDESSQTMLLRVTEQLPVHEDIRIPLNSGIVGAAVQSGEPVIVADAYEDSRFNKDVDLKMGYRTKSVLAIPIKDREGNVFAAVQLLNKIDGEVFSQQDQDRIDHLLTDLSLILESWVGRHA